MTYKPFLPAKIPFESFPSLSFSSRSFSPSLGFRPPSMGDEAREGFASAAQADVAPQPSPAKKRRGREEELRRVAQIVMVLSAMVEMRAGKEPTAAEKALAAEARERLARLCEEVRPKDLFSSEAVRVMVEDLGLNRSRDPVPGFRPPKMSIAERVQHTKKKMEESRDHAASSHASLPHSTNLGPSSETHGSQRLIAGKSNSMVLTAGGFPNNSAVHIPALASSMPSMKQTPTSEAQNAVVKSSFGKDSPSVAMSSVETVNQRLDARINGPTYFTLIRPAAAANYQMEKASASGISTSAALGTQSQANNSMGNHEVKVIQASHQRMKTHDTKGPVVQSSQVNMAIGNQPSQGLTFVHVPSFISNHNEIAKSVMGVVQLKVPDCPNVPLPSTEYMTKPLNCQVCKIIITDVESLLVCDACEKGIHLKCLQFNDTKTIPKADWHCPKCLSANNGKPFPPKYGRVTRNIPAVTTISSGGGTMLVEKNEEIPEAKFNYHKSMENENLSSSSAIQASNFDGKRPREEMCSDTTINHSEEKSGLAFATSGGRSEISDGQTAGIKLPETEAMKPASDSQSVSVDMLPEQSSISISEVQRIVSESMPDIKGQSEYLCFNQNQETVDEIACQSQLTSDLQAIKEANVPIITESTDDLMQKTSTTITDDLKDVSKSSEAFTNQVLEVNLDGQHGSQMMRGQILWNWSDSGNTLLVEDSHKVDWVGDILEVLENRTYYKSCCINGCIVKVQDNVVVSTNNQTLYPAKLLSLWEDNKVWSKLAIVNEYCLPGSLPESVDHPSTPVKDEVYASDRRNTILASSIYGLCDVLPEEKFKEETDRRTLLADKDNVPHPIFMCKWIYDESKGIFQTREQF